MPTYATTHQRLPISPDTRFLHGAAQVAALSDDIVQFRQYAQLARERPHHDDRLHALRSQSAQNLHRTVGIAGKGCISKLVDVITTTVRNGIVHRFRTYLTLAQYQAKLFDFLLGGQQITLDTVSDEHHGITVGLQTSRTHPICNPAGEFANPYRPER
jgi:hypothetical protein